MKKLKYSVLFASLALAFGAQAIEEGFGFHGYVKGGIGITQDAELSSSKYDWNASGMNQFTLPGAFSNTSGGRLGNESNWAEIITTYGWEEKNDMSWGIKSNLSVPGNRTIEVEELYLQGVGVISSNPTATVWAGKRYYARVNTFLSDTQAMASDGAGVGLDRIALGESAKLDLGITRNYYDEGAKDGGAMTVFSSSINDIKLADTVSLNIYANYGTYLGPANDDDSAEAGAGDSYQDAFQLAAKVWIGDWANYDEIFIRYGDNAGRNISSPWEGKHASLIGGFWQGYKTLSETIRLSYIAQYEQAEQDEDSKANGGFWGSSSLEDHTWISLIARGSYVWSERTTTEIEAGWEQVDFDDSNTVNEGYKVTLAQNLHIGSGFWDRPVLRFFVTYADQDIENDYLYAGAPLGSNDALTVGAQYEAWW